MFLYTALPSGNMLLIKDIFASMFLSVGKVVGSMLGPNRVIAKDVKNCTYCCYVRCATLIV